MTTTALKKNIINKLDKVRDAELLKAINAMLDTNIDSELKLTPVQKKELDKRLKLHKAGKLKYYTLAEIKKSTINNRKAK